MTDQDKTTAIDYLTEQVTAGNLGWKNFYADLLAKSTKYGLSEKQVAAVLKAKERDEKFAAEKANATPVVTGKGVLIEGEAVSVKVRTDYYGTKLVWTVKDDRGFRVWGTIPAFATETEAGDRVRFIADVTAADGDETFGFAKRPRKAAEQQQLAVAA